MNRRDAEVKYHILMTRYINNMRYVAICAKWNDNAAERMYRKEALRALTHAKELKHKWKLEF